MIAPACFPTTNPEAMVNAKLALAMVRGGWDVDVVTAQGKIVSWYPQRTGVWGELAERIHVVPTVAPTLWNKVWTTSRAAVRTGQIYGARWALPAMRKAIELAGRKDYDVVLSRSHPADAHLAALGVCQRTHLPWIANWNDPDPMVRFPVPYGNGPDAPLAPGIGRFFRAVARRASWHTFPAERLRRYMAAQWPAMEGKSSTIPHVAMAGPSATPPEGGEFTICYAGSLKPPRDARVLLEGAQRFAQRRGLAAPFLRFMVDHEDLLRQCARQAGAEHLLDVQPPRPYEDMPQHLARSTVLAVIEPELEEGIFLPSKVIDYAQIGRPILAVSPRTGTLNDLLNEHGGGLAVDCRDSTAVEQAIDTLYDCWQRGTLSTRFKSASLLDLFAPARVIQLLGEVIRRVR